MAKCGWRPEGARALGFTKVSVQKAESTVPWVAEATFSKTTVTDTCHLVTHS